MTLDSKIPSGPLAQKWEKHKFDMKLVNPANKRKFEVIVVGSGLAGASAAATMAELGYKVKCFCFQDSPRRAHSIAAQGGINAAKNYPNDGDSVYRLFYDTIKGGDFRAREANVYRLAQVSVNIIDQCVAQGVPFAREYGGLLANRSFGGAQVSRTFYARGQTGQQLLLGAYQALSRQIGAGTVKMFPRTEMLDVVLIDGHAKGIIVRDLVTGEISSHAADAVVLATGGYGNVFYLSTNAQGLQCHRDLARLQEGRGVRESMLHADPSDVHPGERRPSIETHADVGILAQRRARLGAEEKRRHAQGPTRFPKTSAIIFWSGNIRASAISRRAIFRRGRQRKRATRAAASGPGGLGRLSGFCGRHQAAGRGRRCGSVTEIFSTCTKRSPARTPTSADADLSGGALHDGRDRGWITI